MYRILSIFWLGCGVGLGVHSLTSCLYYWEARATHHTCICFTPDRNNT